MAIYFIITVATMLAFAQGYGKMKGGMMPMEMMGGKGGMMGGKGGMMEMMPMEMMGKGKMMEMIISLGKGQHGGNCDDEVNCHFCDKKVTWKIR
jgi:hypothetical protein